MQSLNSDFIDLLFQKRKEIAFLRIRQSLCKVIVKSKKAGIPKGKSTAIFQCDCPCTEVIVLDCNHFPLNPD